jgi:hypothetical protein
VGKATLLRPAVGRCQGRRSPNRSVIGGEGYIGTDPQPLNQATRLREGYPGRRSRASPLKIASPGSPVPLQEGQRRRLAPLVLGRVRERC